MSIKTASLNIHVSDCVCLKCGQRAALGSNKQCLSDNCSFIFLIASAFLPSRQREAAVSDYPLLLFLRLLNHLGLRCSQTTLHLREIQMQTRLCRQGAKNSDE